ncbi:MAG TPA: phage/plasmid primase, P4 family [Phycisphaerales bacterium]|nr:phage/plasmid primase, P4 family [Phycisphaerales bacterium]
MCVRSRSASEPALRLRCAPGAVHTESRQKGVTATSSRVALASGPSSIMCWTIVAAPTAPAAAEPSSRLCYARRAPIDDTDKPRRRSAAERTWSAAALRRSDLRSPHVASRGTDVRGPGSRITREAGERGCWPRLPPGVHTVRSDSRLEAAQDLLRQGRIPIPVPAGKKCPAMSQWQRFRPHAAELPEHFSGAGNIGVLLGEPSGGLVDVDLDCPEALELADRFLPHTPVVTGRRSTPRSHRWYIAVGATTAQYRDPTTRKMIVELRSTGAQTLVGPSVHPESRESYDRLEGQPAIVDAANLAMCVSALAAAVVRMRYPDRSAVGDCSATPARAASARESGSNPGSVPKRAEAYLDKMPPAVSKRSGHSQTYTAAVALVHGFELDEDTAFDLLWKKYNPRCQPPWTEKELRHKVHDAATKPHDKPRGWLRDGPIAVTGTRADQPQISVQTMQDGEGEMDRRPNRTDLGNAERLAGRFKNILRYSHAAAKWYVWDGRRWKMDDEGIPLRCAGETARAILREAEACPSRHTRSSLARWALASESRQRLDAMLGLARSHPDLLVRVADMDSDPHLFNVLNGTVDLRTGELRPHEQSDLITRLAPVEFDPTAACPLFERFLRRIFANDREVIEFLQRWHGHCLTGDISEQYLPIYFGTGANGKSVLLDTTIRVMGEYACPAPPHLLVGDGRHEHPTEIADLMGRRLVVASETEDGSMLKLQMVKRLTGDQFLKGRFMRQDYFTFLRTHKLVLVTNNRPRVREDSEGVWRRLRLIPFGVTIPEAERDTKLGDKLVAESSGFLNWMIAGCLAWRDQGLAEVPDAVARATHAYRANENTVSRFLADRCSAGARTPPQSAKVFTPWQRVWAEYTSWAHEAGETPLDQRAFGEALERLGHSSATQRVLGKPTKGRLGIRLLSGCGDVEETS